MFKSSLLVSLLFCILSYSNSFGQQARLNPDSLLQVVSESEQDTYKANALVNLAEYYANSKSDSCKIYCDKAEIFIEELLNKTPDKNLKELLARVFYLKGSRSLREGMKLSTTESFYQRAYLLYQDINDDLGMAKVLNSISHLHSRMGDTEKYAKIIDRVRTLSNTTADSGVLSGNYTTLSSYFVYLGNIDSAIYYLQQALNIYEAQHNYKRIAYCIGRIGTHYKAKGDYEKALEYAFKGLKICNKINYKKGSMFTLISIGELYVTMGKYERSISFLTSAQEISLQQTNVQAELMIANLLSTSYGKLNEPDSTLKYANMVINIIKISHLGKEYESGSYNRISKIYRKQNNFDKAFFYAQKSLETHKSPNLSSKAAKLYNLGGLYFKQEQLDLAEDLVSQSFNYYSGENTPEGVMKSSLLLSMIYAKQENFASAFKYLKLSETIEDSLYTIKTEQILAEKETQFNLQKKEFEIENNENEIILLKKDKQLKNYTIAGFTLLFISGILVFFSFFQRKKTKELEARNQIIYHINEIQKLKTEIDTLESNKSKLIKKTADFNLNEVLDTPLSERELEVLAELSNGLTNNAISEKLFISVNTVKTHVKNIYIKLDVNNRTQAIKKAQTISNSNI